MMLREIGATYLSLVGRGNHVLHSRNIVNAAERQDPDEFLKLRRRWIALKSDSALHWLIGQIAHHVGRVTGLLLVSLIMIEKVAS
jgi:hypothetical protein